MPYRFAIDRPDYSDLASGKVLLAAPGHPAFPIRLASEIYQRCLAIRSANGFSGRATVYDPCCGAGYIVSVLGILHGATIKELIASDIDPEAVSLADRNLRLLSVDGFTRRQRGIEEMLERYGKESHAEALAAARRIRQQLFTEPDPHPIRIRTFQADALERTGIERGLAGASIDCVLTDVPYGIHSQWRLRTADGRDPSGALLEALRPSLQPQTVLAIASDKAQRVAHPAYRQIERLKIGKRQVAFFQPIG